MRNLIDQMAKDKISLANQIQVNESANEELKHEAFTAEEVEQIAAAAGIDVSGLSLDDLALGAGKEAQEHDDDNLTPEQIVGIAHDHLVEDPNYYAAYKETTENSEVNEDSYALPDGSFAKKEGELWSYYSFDNKTKKYKKTGSSRQLRLTTGELISNPESEQASVLGVHKMKMDVKESTLKKDIKGIKNGKPTDFKAGQSITYKVHRVPEGGGEQIIINFKDGGSVQINKDLKDEYIAEGKPTFKVGDLVKGRSTNKQDRDKVYKVTKIDTDGNYILKAEGENKVKLSGWQLKLAEGMNDGQPEKLKIVGRSMVNKQMADDMARRTPNASVVSDKDDPKKFMVVVKESQYVPIEERSEGVFTKGNVKIVIVRKPETDEWVAKWYENGKYSEDKTNYETSKEDAIATAKKELERVKESRLKEATDPNAMTYEADKYKKGFANSKKGDIKLNGRDVLNYLNGDSEEEFKKIEAKRGKAYANAVRKRADHIEMTYGGPSESMNEGSFGLILQRTNDIEGSLLFNLKNMRGQTTPNQDETGMLQTLRSIDAKGKDGKTPEQLLDVLRDTESVEIDTDSEVLKKSGLKFEAANNPSGMAESINVDELAFRHLFEKEEGEDNGSAKKAASLLRRIHKAQYSVQLEDAMDKIEKSGVKGEIDADQLAFLKNAYDRKKSMDLKSGEPPKKDNPFKKDEPSEEGSEQDPEDKLQSEDPASGTEEEDIDAMAEKYGLKESGEAFQMSSRESEEGDYAIYTFSGFRLNLGNNYTHQHFIDALKEEQPEIVKEIGSFGLNDEVEFKYKGNYGEHEDVWAVSDLVDFLREKKEMTEKKSDFSVALDKVYAGLKEFEDRVYIEYAEAINVFPKWMEEDEGETQAPAWIEIYAPHDQLKDKNLTSLAVYDTPDHPFGEDEPVGIYDLDDTDQIIDAVKKLIPKVEAAEKPVEESNVNEETIGDFNRKMEEVGKLAGYEPEVMGGGVMGWFIKVGDDKELTFGFANGPLGYDLNKLPYEGEQPIESGEMDKEDASVEEMAEFIKQTVAKYSGKKESVEEAKGDTEKDFEVRVVFKLKATDDDAAASKIEDILNKGMELQGIEHLADPQFEVIDVEEIGEKVSEAEEDEIEALVGKFVDELPSGEEVKTQAASLEQALADIKAKRPDLVDMINKIENDLFVLVNELLLGMSGDTEADKADREAKIKASTDKIKSALPTEEKYEMKERFIMETPESDDALAKIKSIQDEIESIRKGVVDGSINPVHAMKTLTQLGHELSTIPNFNLAPGGMDESAQSIEDLAAKHLVESGPKHSNVEAFKTWLTDKKSLDVDDFHKLPDSVQKKLMAEFEADPKSGYQKK